MTFVPGQLVVTTSEELIVTSPQPSVAVATPVTFVVVMAGHSSTRFEGQIIEGGVVSRTVMVCTQLLVLPHWSVAIQVRAMTFVLAQFVVTTSAKLTVAWLHMPWAVATPVTLVV